MSDKMVARPGDLIDHEWLESSRPEELIRGLYVTAACLLDIAHRGSVALEEETGHETEDTVRELVSTLVRLTAVGAHSLAKHHGLLPSQREGSA